MLPLSTELDSTGLDRDVHFHGKWNCERPGNEEEEETGILEI